ncbi:MAG TPA: hypothetical protein VI547_01660 [Anaerolineales bacterium]|nr:hypothetical protein [Anaerolineales bacterium]
MSLERSVVRPSVREWGDFQTPLPLARQICRFLRRLGVSPSVIVEPTFGLGHFIIAALDTFPDVQLVYGVEIQDKYQGLLEDALRQRANVDDVSAEIRLIQGNIFTHRFPVKVTQAENLLILGNPPWVTNAELGAAESGNLPKKRNLKALSGLDALTGKSNFDICEYILLKLLETFSEKPGTLAMLCKTATARNIVHILPQKHFKVANVRVLEVNAGREFGAAVDACLLVMTFGVRRSAYICEVSSLDDPDHTERIFGWAGDKFVSDIQNYDPELDGDSPWVWRQGVKHDCARIMELGAKDGVLLNGEGRAVEVESDHFYWLLKGSDLREFEIAAPRKKVILTQTHLADDTQLLMMNAPKLWAYLIEHEPWFMKRKSSIYRNKPRFSMFGVGDYSFKPYKVAISGLHKEAKFSLVCPLENRPVMLDDTCYFLGFDNYLDALLTASVLNSESVRKFLRSVVFVDAKRPYTKDVLMRINLAKAAMRSTLLSLHEYWASVDYTPQSKVTEAEWLRYQQILIPETQQLGLVV